MAKKPEPPNTLRTKAQTHSRKSRQILDQTRFRFLSGFERANSAPGVGLKSAFEKVCGFGPCNLCTAADLMAYALFAARYADLLAHTLKLACQNQQRCPTWPSDPFLPPLLGQRKGAGRWGGEEGCERGRGFCAVDRLFPPFSASRARHGARHGARAPPDLFPAFSASRRVTARHRLSKQASGSYLLGV